MSEMIDVNVTLFPWPFRRTRGDEPGALVELLAGHGVTQAWVGSNEAVFHRDIASANERLATACHREGQGLLLPFGTVNPAWPDWQDDLRRCAELHGMRGVRLFPNYHGYALDRPEFAELVRAAAERKMLVQIALSLEDERTQSPLARAPHVDPQPLCALLPKSPEASVMLVNVFRAARGAVIDELVRAGVAAFDIAMLEGTGGVAALVQQVGPERVVFGSHAPFFYWSAAELKLRESALGGALSQQIVADNARRLLGESS